MENQELVIRAPLTQEQIRILALALWWKEFETKQIERLWKIKVKVQDNDNWKLLFDENNEPTIKEIEVEQILTESINVPNSKTDDDHVIEYFLSMIVWKATEVFAKAGIDEIEKQKVEHTLNIKKQIENSVTWEVVK
jgi:hypothetical protein